MAYNLQPVTCKLIGAAAVCLCCFCSESAGPLTCQWFYDDNCWKDSLAEVMDCVPDTSIRGALSADRETCIYPDGTRIDIELPSEENNNTLDFEITANDEACLTGRWVFNPPRTKLSLKTASGKFTFREDATTATITCQDGRRFFTDDKHSIAECLNGSAIIEPYGVYGENITVGIEGPAGVNVVLFDCI